MKLDKKDLLLYAVTDRHWLGGKTLCEQVKEALDGGVTFLQLREKELCEEEFLAQALQIKELCREYGVPFVINDNADIALKAGADGIHVGQSDMNCHEVRARLGSGKIIGVSAHTVEEAVFAEQNGADYLGVGAMFNTDSKADARSVAYETLKEICNAVSIPVIAIGGIGKNNVETLTGSGICGIAVISAVFAQADIKSAAAELKKLTQKMVVV